MKDIRDFRRRRCGWNGCEIIGDAELAAIFARRGYANPPHGMTEFVPYLYGRDLRFANNNGDNHVTIMCDAGNNIYGIIDDCIYRFGNDYSRFVEAVAENNCSHEQP